MRKLFALLVFTLVVSSTVRGQGGSSSTSNFGIYIAGSVVPTRCSAPRVFTHSTTGIVYTCQAGVYVPIVTGGFPRLDQVLPPTADTTLDLGTKFLSFRIDDAPVARQWYFGPTLSGFSSAQLKADADLSTAAFTVLNPSAATPILYALSGFLETNTNQGGFAGFFEAVKTGSGTTSYIGGISAEAFNEGSGNNTFVHAIESSGAVQSGTGTVAELAGLYLNSNVKNGGSGAVTSNYGAYIADQGSKATTNYGLFMEDQTNSSGTNYAIKTGLGLVSFGDAVAGVATNKISTYALDITALGTNGTSLPNGASLLGKVNTANGITTSDALGALIGISNENPAAFLTNGLGLVIQGCDSSVTNCTGITVQDQSGTGTNYAIKTGLGLVSFGDTALITSTSNTGAIGFQVVDNTSTAAGSFPQAGSFIVNSNNTSGSAGDVIGLGVVASHTAAGTADNVIGVEVSPTSGGGGVTTSIGVKVNDVTGAVTNYGLYAGLGTWSTKAAMEWRGTTSGTAQIGVAAAAGTPNKILLPTATGTAGYVLKTDGANPQQTSWVSPPTTANYCGTTTTCGNTIQVDTRIVYGTVTLSSGAPSTATVASISPAFTSSSSYVCTGTQATSAVGNLIKIVNVSGSSFTITGPATVTDVIGYICIGN